MNLDNWDLLSNRVRKLETAEDPVVYDLATSNVSSPPTQGEANAAFGATAAQVRDGWSGVIYDNVDSLAWLATSINDTWWFAGIGTSGVGPHTILDATVHTDTVTQAVSRGSLIYGDSTPKWNELVHPAAANRLLTTDANDVLWATWSLVGTAGQTYTFPAVGGTVVLGSGTNGQVAYFGAGNQLASGSNLTWNGAGPLRLTTGAAGNIGYIAQANAAQTADLFQCLTSVGAVYSRLTKDGRFWYGAGALYGVFSGAGYNPQFLVAIDSTPAINTREYALVYDLTLLSNTTAGFLAAGMQGTIRFSGAGTQAEMVGVQAQAYNTGAGTVTAAYGFRGTVGRTAAGTVTNGYAFYASNPVGAAGTFYGLYIEYPSTATTKYAIWSAGGESYLISGNTALVPLTVRGTGVQTADLQRWQSSTPATLDVITAAGWLGVGHGTPDRLFHTETADAGTNTIVYNNRKTHATSAAATTLFGVGQEDELEDSVGNMQVASEQVTLWADATTAVESPLYRITTYPKGSAGPGYAGHWTWDALDGTARTMVPNGTGDAIRGFIANVVVYAITGADIYTGNYSLEPSTNVEIYNDGTDIAQLQMAADGSVTVQRTAGADTFKVEILGGWLYGT